MCKLDYFISMNSSLAIISYSWHSSQTWHSWSFSVHFFNFKCVIWFCLVIAVHAKCNFQYHVSTTIVRFVLLLADSKNGFIYILLRNHYLCVVYQDSISSFCGVCSYESPTLSIQTKRPAQNLANLSIKACYINSKCLSDVAWKFKLICNSVAAGTQLVD